MSEHEHEHEHEENPKESIIKIAITAALSLAAGEVPAASWSFDKLEEGRFVSTDGRYEASVTQSEKVAAVPGKLGGAVSIHGKYRGGQAGALTVKDFPLDFAKPFTAEVLVKFDAGIGRKLRREIFSMTDGERGPGIRFSYYVGALDLSTGDGKTMKSVRTGAAFSVTPDVWHLLTVTYDGKKVVLYCDGIPVGEKELTILPARKMEALSIGSYKNGLAYPLQGVIDDLGFYDFCKTPAQTAERYIAIFGE